MLDKGTLSIDGSYSIYGDSILQMENAGELLQVGGDFAMASDRAHHSLLSNGRMELGGSFSQSGNAASFASSDDFVVAFVGEGTQEAYFQDIYKSDFAHVDPRYADYKRTNNFLLDTGKIMYQLCLGMLEGLQEMLTLPELSETAAAAMVTLGISITAGALLAPEIVIPILQAIASTVGAFFSGFMVVSSAANMYGTANTTATRYEKARMFGKDGIILVLSVIVCKQATTEMIKNAKNVRDILLELKTNGYAGVKTNPSMAKRAGIGNCQALQDYVKGKVDDDALVYLEETLQNYNDKQLRNVAEVIDGVYDATSNPLDETCVKRILEKLDDFDGESVTPRRKRQPHSLKRGDAQFCAVASFYGRKNISPVMKCSR